jgi:hypothetical protein
LDMVLAIRMDETTEIKLTSVAMGVRIALWRMARGTHDLSGTLVPRYSPPGNPPEVPVNGHRGTVQ